VRLRLVIIGAAILLPGIFYLNKASAAPAAVPKTSPGITLSPAIVQASISGTEAERTIDFQITNNQPFARTIDISTADFNTLGESGGLVFVGTNPSQLQKKYGLATWMTLPETTITLEPKQTTTVSAFISNQGSLAPGGHYGALLLSLENSSQANSTPGNNVSLHPIASSLLFVDKVGGDTHRLRLNNVIASKNIFKLPSTITLRFYNDGNTHLVPRGTIEITDPRGKLVSKGIINENSNLILPETYRRFLVPLNKTASSVIPGKYKITTHFRFDGYDQVRSYQSSQLLITPQLLLLIVFAVLIIVAAAILLLSKKQRINIHFSKLKKTRKKAK
jgi:hypothetical protein